VIKSENGSARPYVTKDGSVIRELMHPDVHGNRNQSLAEATLAPGRRSRLHRHRESEELYHILAGRGDLTVGGETAAVSAGDTVCIPPGTAHFIANTGDGPLVFLCCASPAYRHADTRLLPGRKRGLTATTPET
jgi:mannose-6-phosphate isomerase-like protein (cupin superfamily)